MTLPTQSDFIVSDGPGQPVRLDLQEALQSLAICSAGATAPTTTRPGMLWLDTSVPPDGLLKMRDQADSAWLAVIPGTPVKASSAEVITGTDDSKFVTPKGIADRALVTPKVYRNRLINGAMQISQENGDTASAVVNFYPADQWLASFLGGAHSNQRVVSLTPRKSQRRLRWTVTTPLVTLAATSYFGWFQRIEGIDVADFGWGAAGAKQIIVRFGFKGPAGTYALTVRNTAPNRTYTKLFTITAGQANTDTEQIIIVPGDVTGAWAVDNSIGLGLSWAMAAGSTYAAGTNNAWAAGNFLGAAGMSNGMAAAGVFEIFDVGVYLDTFNTGLPPLWELPDEASELIACQRYYCNNVFTWYNAYMNTGYAQYVSGWGPVEMRAVPTYAGVNVGTPVGFPVTVGAPSGLGTRYVRDVRTSNATIANASFMTNWALNARL